MLASKPIDVGVAAIVNGNQAALRAVAASNGQVVGRAQARFAPMGGGPLMTSCSTRLCSRSCATPVRRTRCGGLTGSEVLDMSGPLALGADIGGRWADPGNPRIAAHAKCAVSKAR